jgi:hypothetical protein
MKRMSEPERPDAALWTLPEPSVWTLGPGHDSLAANGILAHLHANHLDAMIPLAKSRAGIEATEAALPQSMTMIMICYSIQNPVGTSLNPRPSAPKTDSPFSSK